MLRLSPKRLRSASRRGISWASIQAMPLASRRPPSAWSRAAAQVPTPGSASRQRGREPKLPTSGTSKSAVIRRLVAATAARVGEELARLAGDLGFAAVMIDGIYFGEHVVLITFGIDESGNEHVLWLPEDSIGECRVGPRADH